MAITFSSDVHHQLPQPLFELRGPLAKVDLSAWISGLCLAMAIALIGLENMLQNTAGMMGFALAYMAFFVSVLLLQRYMRIAMSAHTFGSPKHLVSTGMFKYSRNPIYVAYLAPLATLAVFSLPIAIGTIAIYILAMNLTVIRKEERDLQSIFGAAFSAYRVSVPRWLF
jgi:protein-S-isoprenylcysteine O-methyltransferase Ste14